MVGNKHKNGIICTFPGCDKTMRTQKFKIHFTKAHLKQGEVYTVEHRRRFEVAREDGGGGGGGNDSPSGGAGGGVSGAGELPVELDAAVDKIKHDPAISTHPGALQPSPQAPPTPVLPTNPAAEPARREDDGQHLAELAAQTAGHATDLLHEARAAADMAWAMTKQPSPPVQPSVQAYEPPQAQVQAPPLRTPDASNPHKRPAAVLEEPVSAEAIPPAAAVASTADPSNTLLVEFVALMDRRFQELVGKVGEMLDVQKELIDALKGSDPSALSHQAPALALASAAEAVMKKRKRASPASNGGTGSAVV
jgi:hypothetical protein